MTDSKNTRVTSNRRLAHLLHEMEWNYAKVMLRAITELDALACRPGTAIVKTFLPGSGQATAADDAGWNVLAPGEGTGGPLGSWYYDAVKNKIPATLNPADWAVLPEAP